MTSRMKPSLSGTLALCICLGAGGALSAQMKPIAGPPQAPAGGTKAPRASAPAPRSPSELYSIEQSISEKAQLSTIAFSALAFMTGTFGADTFLPPGKAADYFGFQYMRDIDIRGAGHNMMFLTNAANNVLAILSEAQKAALLALAAEQEPLFAELARKRLVLIEAFRGNMEGRGPAGNSGLSGEAVASYVGGIFEIDGKLATARAAAYGELVGGLGPAQRASLGKLAFADSAAWPELPDQYDKRGVPHGQDVLIMTYASEFLSWYAGSETADLYFCPERHATYFGGFYMKDYPAMGNRDYFIPTALTGDSGEAFLALLEPAQRERITSISAELPAILGEILSIRTAISREFRKYLSGGTADDALVMSLSRRYGELDGRLSCLMAERFAEVYRTLSPGQKTAMSRLRNQDVFPEGYYLYADLVQGTFAEDATFLFAK